MNLAELQTILAGEGIDPSRYALDPRDLAAHVSAYRIGIHHKHWCVWYAEHGYMTEEHRFASEDEACRYLLDVLRLERDRPDRLESEPGEVLAGGVNQVVRIGPTVHRPAGPWTPAVQALLSHLADVGFDGAPRAKGFDEAGREVVSYIPGDVTNFPRADYATTDLALGEVATLLRHYHDATVDFVPPVGTVWQLPARAPVEVICHGDVAHYNCVFRNGHPVAFIDFDTAHPGPRRLDVAYAAYRFVPLSSPSTVDFTLPLDQQMIRLRLFCDAYGLGPDDRDVLPDTAIGALRELIERMRERAGAGEEAYQRHVNDGHDVVYLADIAHIEANATHLRRAVRM
jgi:hypothetical protein